MNNLKIKINGTEISLESSAPVAGNLALDTSEAENLCASLSKESDTLSKQIKAISLLSDVKSVESFGYKSTEAVGENIKNAFSTAGAKVKEFIDKIITAIKNFIGKKVVEVQIAAADKRERTSQLALMLRGIEGAQRTVELCGLPGGIDHVERSLVSNDAVGEDMVAFVLMGLHLGMHIPAMAVGMRLSGRTRTILTVIFTFVSGVGLWLFLRNGMPDYLFFRVQFAFLDYEKAGALVLFENLLMLSFWAFAGTQAAHICRNAGRAAQKAKAEAKAQRVKNTEKAAKAEIAEKAENVEITKIPEKAEKANGGKNPLLPVVALMASVIIGILLTA
jgi:hypothetical protein